jgi:microsomal epoxide hydrolase
LTFCFAGFDTSDAARVFHKLMLRLGHTHYYVQGGDWGSAIVNIMSKAYPSNILGMHINMFVVPFNSIVTIKQLIGTVLPSLIYSPTEIKDRMPLMDIFRYWLKESGYMHLQATKPDTVAFGLNDSPVGLAAYILEKFSTWTNRDNRQCPDGCLSKYFTLDELLTEVMIYWTTETIGSSMRFYKETVSSPETFVWMSIPVDIPSAIAAFPQEFPGSARSFANQAFHNIVQYTDMPRGGHFAAFEVPQLLADDIRSFVWKVEEGPSEKTQS